MTDSELWLFLILTVGVIGISLHAIRTRATYGLYRFLAFETLAALVSWNAGDWFEDPFCPRQMLSWILLACSAALAIHGFYLLRTVGKAQHHFIEDTQVVVERGAYRYIRHPLYGSLTLMGWGTLLKSLDWRSVGLAVATSLFVYATARWEERFNMQRFGNAYAEYMDRTWMFVPHVL